MIFFHFLASFVAGQTEYIEPGIVEQKVRETGAQSRKCPENFSLSISDDRVCLRKFNIKTDWEIAQKVCEDLNANLVTIRSQDMQDEINLVTTERIWLGFQRDSTNQFKWVTGDDVDFTYWGQNQPDNSGNSENCAENHPTFQWNDRNCIGSNEYICEVKSELFGVCNDDACSYEFFAERSTFIEAQDHCESIGKILAVPHRSEVYESFQEFTSWKYSAWIGTKYQCDTKMWLGSDGTEIPRDNQINPIRQPQESMQCSYTYKGFSQWWHGNCDWRNPFICQKAVPANSLTFTEFADCERVNVDFCSDANCTYEIFGGEHTFAEGKAKCESVGKRLAVPRDSTQDVLFGNLIDDIGRMWIGIKYQNDIQKWVDLDGNEITHFNWVTKENGGVYDYPSGELNDTCAYVTRGGGWRNNPCQFGDKNFICENGGVCSDQNCAYELFSTRRTFKDAQENCAKIGKILAVPHNIAEFKMLGEIYSEVSFGTGISFFWIGTKYQCDDKKWTNSDGTKPDMSLHKAGNRDKETDNCGYSLKGWWTWWNTSCDAWNVYICQKVVPENAITFTNFNSPCVETCEISWAAWNPCSASCGGGMKVRTGTCDVTDQISPCNTEVCVVSRGKNCFCEPTSNGYLTVSCSSPSCGAREVCNLQVMPSELHTPGDKIDDFICQSDRLNTCEASGDPHVYTFDGAQNDVYGVAEYVLSKTHDDIEKVSNKKYFQFSMTTVREPISIFHNAYLQYYRANDLIQVEMLGTGTARINEGNGWQTLQPQLNPELRYSNAGRTQSLQLYFGLYITVKPYYAKIKVPGFYYNDLLGICGNNNQNMEDDFILKNGTLLPYPKKTDDQDSWLGVGGYKQSPIEKTTAESWILGPAELKKDIYLGPTKEELDECDKYYSECELLLQAEWLEDCFNKFEMDKKIKACSLELCGHDTIEKLNLGKQIMLTDFIRECKQFVPNKLAENHSIFCEWPSLSGFQAPECPINQKFDPCAKQCNLIDCNLNTEISCDGTETLEPLCICSAGFVMNNNHCVREGECPVGVWGNWNVWSTCARRGDSLDKTIIRSRMCGGDGPCEGENSEILSCETTCRKTKDCARNEACINLTCKCAEGYLRIGAECEDVYTLEEEIAAVTQLNQLDNEVSECVNDFMNANNINKLKSLTNKFDFFDRATRKFLQKYHHIKFVVEKRKQKSGDSCECIRDAADAYVTFFNTLHIDMTRFNVQKKITSQGVKIKRILNQRGNCGL